MDIELIRNEAEYRQALREIESLMDAEYGTPEGERLDHWARLVEAYEAIHYPVEMSGAERQAVGAGDLAQGFGRAIPDIPAERVNAHFYKA